MRETRGETLTNTADTCPGCGSSDLRTIRMDHGPHYARLECGTCGRFLRWLPRPRPETSAAGFARAAAAAPALNDPLPPLVGSDKQIAFAESIRSQRLRCLARALSPDAYRAARGITSASWWISNRNNPADQLRWPSEWFAAEPADVEATAGISTSN